MRAIDREEVYRNRSRCSIDILGGLGCSDPRVEGPVECPSPLDTDSYSGGSGAAAQRALPVVCEGPTYDIPFVSGC